MLDEVFLCFFFQIEERVREMKVIFHSRTGNIRRFIRKLGLQEKAEKLEENLAVHEPYLLITYTDKIGEVPLKVSEFLKKNSHHLAGVASSGNKNFGTHFAKSADVISEMYHVPIVCKFELAGNEKDLLTVKGWVVNYETKHVN